MVDKTSKQELNRMESVQSATSGQPDFDEDDPSVKMPLRTLGKQIPAISARNMRLPEEVKEVPPLDAPE